jgi:phage shock protein PspC (stress-responsive transcriptional regulator)
MKKTIKINLSGSIFHLDEDAYHKLKEYLDKIHKHFESKKGGKEIIDDIELRIAELFQHKTNKKKEVISLEDVEEIIDQMGDADEFDEQEPTEHEDTEAKKLYRDPDRAILGGVAAGIGAYFNIDPVWIRLMLVLLIFAYGIIALIYILFWLFVPRAETYKQKMEMRGEKISISEIEKRVRQEYDDVKSNLKEFERSDHVQNFKNGLNEIFAFLGKLIKGLFSFIIGIIGIALVIAGVVISLYAASVLFTDMPADWFLFSEWFNFPVALLTSLFEPAVSITLVSAVALTCLIPLLGIIYLLFRIFGYKGNDKVVYPIGVIFWILAIMTLIGTSFYQVSQFSANVTNHHAETLNISREQSLKLELADKPEPSYLIEEFPFTQDYGQKFGLSEEGMLYLTPVIKIIPGESTEYKMELKRVARGRNTKHAVLNTRGINYSWDLSEGTLKLDPYFLISNENKFHMQKLVITLKIPDTKHICISEEIEEYIVEAGNNKNYNFYELGDKCWEMQGGELRVVDE